MEKLELTKSESDNLVFRQNIIQKKMQDIILLQNEISIIKRDSLAYIKDVLLKNGKEYGKDGDWAFDGSFLTKNDK